MVVAPANRVQTEPAIHEPRKLAPGRATPELVLVVEDDVSTRKFIVRALAPVAGEVLSTGSGRRALTLACARLPDVVVLDLRLPGLHGVQLVEQFRAKGIPAPVVVLSGYLGDLPTDVSDLGIFTCLEKPVTLAELQDAVRRAAITVANWPRTTPIRGDMNASARWVAVVFRGIRSPADLRNREDLARFCAVSLSVLKEICTRAHTGTRETVRFIRVLRALVRSREDDVGFEDLFDVGDHRTLGPLFEEAGLTGLNRQPTIEEYLSRQNFVTRTSDALRLLETTLRTTPPKGRKKMS